MSATSSSRTATSWRWGQRRGPPASAGRPGGICIARNVWNQVKAKLDLAFDPMGDHRVKNIAEPVTVYRVNLGARPRLAPPSVWTRRPWEAAAAGVMFLLALGAGGAWYGLRQPAPGAITGEGAAVVPTAAEKPSLPLPLCATEVQLAKYPDMTRLDGASSSA